MNINSAATHRYQQVSHEPPAHANITMESAGGKPPNAGTSLQEFRNSFETVRKVTYMVGIDPFTMESDLNVRFFGSTMFMALIYALCFYTGWELRDAEGYRILEMAMILVLNAQGTNKMWIGFVHKSRYCQLFQSSEQIYESFDGDARNRPILRNLVAKMNLLLKWIVIVYASSGLLIVVLVALYAIVAREKFLALTIIVPFVNHTSLTGYLIVYLTHMAMAAFCANGYLASDTAFIVTVVPIIAYANSLQNEIRNFNLLLQAPERDEALIAEKLLRICQLHQMIDEFEQEAIAHFKGGCLVQVALQAGTLLLTIFLAYICGYVQALSIFMALIFQLTQYCALGTIVTAKNDQMINDIYEIGWHRLDKPQQQMVAFMLHRAQNAKELSVGGVAPLNLVTYVQIMKTTYSFLAMLITLFG
ncbi:odorant receptor 67d [Culex quinquefasciatus]|uniref:odorant receptor 67d n=1 Tax=Culex quinquefasciatus TaxID=7176 RepID=UPI0018E3B894|nr:odorant receptor 67d [Culex quinquefasciatus]